MASAAHKPLQPFTVDHFRKYAGNMVLDNGDPWQAEPFQLEVVEDLFAGHLELWAVLPEGNAKTTLMSGVALYHADYEQDAFVCMAASSRDQAGLLFGQAGGFVRRSPGFEDRFRVYDGYRKIVAKRTDGTIQVYAADDRTGDGVIFTLALIDELHRHRDMRLYRTWRGKLDKREGQLIAISTAGEPDTEFENVRELARNTGKTTVDGFHTRAVKGSLVLHDWSVPADADVEDMTVVKKANPLSSITAAKLNDKRTSPSMNEAHWRRFVCNQPVRSDYAAIDEREWADALTDEQIPPGVPIWVGIDAAWKIDSFAIVPFWMPDREKRIFGTPKVLTPPKDGSIKPKQVREAFKAIHERNPVERVVMDINFAHEIVEWLEDELGIEVISHSQTDKPMGLVYERFMKALRNGWLMHTGDETFTRHVLNAVTKKTRTGYDVFARPSDSRSREEQTRRVIDALIAGGMVHSIADAELSEPTKRAFLELDEYTVSVV